MFGRPPLLDAARPPDKAVLPLSTPLVEPGAVDRTQQRWRRAEVFLAAVSCAAVGSQVVITQSITVGTALPLVLAPLWWRSVRGYRGGRLVFALGAVALLCGWFLTEYASATHEASGGDLLRYSLLFLSLLTTIGVLLWAREMIPSTMAVWFACGLLVHAALLTATPNLWKYSLSVPVVVLLLAVAAWRRSRALEAGALVLTTAVSALNDSRSLASMLVMALALVAWQVVRGALRLRSTAFRTIVNLLLLGAVLYGAMQSLILDGFLGRAAQERSMEQIATTGNLITGGRPELGASLALISHQPWGYGSGTIPSLSDIFVAKTGMSGLNYNPNNGYVDNYLFANGYEVHSVIGDLWIHFGMVGAALALILVGFVLVSTSRRIAVSSATALCLFLTIRVVWDLFFGPFFAESIAVLGLAVALALSRRDGPRAAASGDDD